MGLSTLFQFIAIRQVNLVERTHTHTHTFTNKIDVFETTTKIFISIMVVTVRALFPSHSLYPILNFLHTLSRLTHIFIPLECGNSDISSLWLAIRFIFISHSKWINDGISEFYCVIHRKMSCFLHELCYLPFYGITHFTELRFVLCTMYICVYVCVVYTNT